MSHKDAPPETPSQIACRQWWTNAQPHVTRAWGRAKDGNFLAEESRLLHKSWEAAQPRPEALNLDALAGLAVSVDVDGLFDSEGRRLFGEVTHWQKNEGSPHGIILLIQDPEPNWKAVPQPPSAPVDRIGSILQTLRRLALVIREHGTCAPLALDHIGDDLEVAISALAQQPAAPNISSAHSAAGSAHLQLAAVDGIRARLVECRDWFAQQADTISKGSGSTWDMLQCQEQRDLCDAAIADEHGAPSGG